MKKISKNTIFPIFLISSFFLILTVVLAADTPPTPIGNRVGGELVNAAKEIGYNPGAGGQPIQDFVQGAMGIINVLLTVVGIFFLLLVIYGGYLWMTAQGKEEQIQKAKKIIEGAVIGIIIILTARIITEFVISQFGTAVAN